MGSQTSKLSKYEVVKNFQYKSKNRELKLAQEKYTNNEVVIKCSKKNISHSFRDSNGDKWVREEFFLRYLHHLNLTPAVLETFQENNWDYMIIESYSFTKWSNLLEYILERKSLSEIELKFIVRQLIGSYAILRLSYGVMYLDIKPENVMINRNSLEIQLIDFEDAFFIQELHKFRKFGSIGYRSPELLWTEDRICVAKAQVYGIGSLAFTCFTGLSALNENWEKILLKQECSEDLQDMLLRCHKPNPEDRIPYEKLLDHPWFC